MLEPLAEKEFTTSQSSIATEGKRVLEILFALREDLIYRINNEDNR